MPLEFNEQVKLFLSQPGYNEMYSDHIAFNDKGEVTASRCLVYMDNVDWYNLKNQIDALNEQRDLSGSQPINQGHSEWRFFMYFYAYDLWELYRVSVLNFRKPPPLVLLLSRASLSFWCPTGLMRWWFSPALLSYTLT